MLNVSCGYQGSPNGQEFLVYHGPVVWVDVGFDAKYKAEETKAPPIPGISRIEALVDTGAEESCIDASLASQLRLPIVDRRKVCGVHGSMEVNMHLAQVHIPALKFTLHGAFAGVHLVAGGHPNRVLIGRTFLKHFIMEYDGKTGAVTIFSP
jgi:predicted aspartyl protease